MYVLDNIIMCIAVTRPVTFKYADLLGSSIANVVPSLHI